MAATAGAAIVGYEMEATTRGFQSNKPGDGEPGDQRATIRYLKVIDETEIELGFSRVTSTWDFLSSNARSNN